jgi:hypothetical protein
VFSFLLGGGACLVLTWVLHEPSCAHSARPRAELNAELFTAIRDWPGPERPTCKQDLAIQARLAEEFAAGLLPVAEYPLVTPPMVRVSAVYPGANAQVVADTIAAPIEPQDNGVEKMM